MFDDEHATDLAARPRGGAPNAPEPAGPVAQPAAADQVPQYYTHPSNAWRVPLPANWLILPAGAENMDGCAPPDAAYAIYFLHQELDFVGVGMTPEELLKLAEMAFATDGRQVTVRQFRIGPVTAAELMGVAEGGRFHGFVHEERVFMFMVVPGGDDDAVYDQAIKVMERLELVGADAQP